MRIVERGILCHDEAGGPRAVASFPSVTVLPDGQLLAVYRIGWTKDSGTSVTEFRRSRDGGRTWSEPERPFRDDPFQVVYVTVLGSGRLLASALWVDREAHPGKPLFNAETEGCLPMKVLVANSEDLGVTWTEWREVAVPPDVGSPSLTNPVLALPDGRLVVSIETNKHWDDRSAWMQRVVHCESRDGGRTWSSPQTVCEDPEGRVFHWDQRAVVTTDGRIAAFSWTYDKPANRYLNIRRHIAGATDELDFADQPSHPALLADGRVVLAWVDRYGSRSIRARLAATIDGRFDPDSEVVIHQAPQPATATGDTGALLVDMGMWCYGLPYAEALPDGDAMVVYYAGEPDRMDIRWVRMSVDKT